MKTIGIVAHSCEGGGLCFLTACRHGGEIIGEHMHPPVVLSAIPMGLSMPAWRSDQHEVVSQYLLEGVRQVAAAGADFFICPDNTAHLVLEKYASEFEIPGLHIADVVCDKIASLGLTKAGLLGTVWTMTGPVYEEKLKSRNIQKLVPSNPTQQRIDKAIFDELCNGVFLPETTHEFVLAIESLHERGAECVILGCTEIPLIISDENSSLPVIDSTRLLAQKAVELAIAGGTKCAVVKDGWLIHE